MTAGQQLAHGYQPRAKATKLKEAVTLKQEQLNLKLEENQIVLAQIEAELGVLRRTAAQRDVADRVRSL